MQHVSLHSVRFDVKDTDTLETTQLLTLNALNEFPVLFFLNWRNLTAYVPSVGLYQNIVIFSLRATILINLNLNLNLTTAVRQILPQSWKREFETEMNTRMWANAQRDGRPAKYRWRPLFNETMAMMIWWWQRHIPTGHKYDWLIMVALCNKADHYIFALWFLSSSFFFSSPIISAVGDCMSTILPHMMWP